MRVGIVTNRNLRSPWASTHFYIHRALRRLGIDAVHVARKEIAEYHARQGSRKNKHGGMQPVPFTPELTEAVKRDIERGPYDILLGLHASTVIPSLEFGCPLVYVTDATAALLNSYYPRRQGLSDEAIEWLDKCEEMTISRANAILVPSQWAAESVLQDYGAEPHHVHTIEWGGNLDNQPEPIDKSRGMGDGDVQFLFVGLDWERKGGDIAVDMVNLLRANGVKANLTVVGAKIPKQNRSPYVNSVGMLNRANPEQSAQLDELFQTADFYVHPARAECYGHVLCEALGFGVPVLAAQTGGVPQCVLDGETGVLLSPDSTAKDYAARAQELIADKETLADMRKNAVQDYRRRLTWDRWAPHTQEVMTELLSPKVSTSSE